LFRQHELFGGGGEVTGFDYGYINAEIFNLHIVHSSVTLIVI